jgi:hypothetical protein
VGWGWGGGWGMRRRKEGVGADGGAQTSGGRGQPSHLGRSTCRLLPPPSARTRAAPHPAGLTGPGNDPGTAGPHTRRPPPRHMQTPIQTCKCDLKCASLTLCMHTRAAHRSSPAPGGRRPSLRTRRRTGPGRARPTVPPGQAIAHPPSLPPPHAHTRLPPSGSRRTIPTPCAYPPTPPRAHARPPRPVGLTVRARHQVAVAHRQRQHRLAVALQHLRV